MPDRDPDAALVPGHGRDPAGARALQVAADLARRLPARLHVVHGVDLADYPIDPDVADWEEQARHTLADQHRAVSAALGGTGAGWTYHAADPSD